MARFSLKRSGTFRYSRLRLWEIWPTLCSTMNVHSLHWHINTKTNLFECCVLILYLFQLNITVQQYSPQNMQNYNFEFFLLILYPVLMIKSRSKLRFLEVLGHFVKRFLLCDNETCFTGISGVLSIVYKVWSPVSFFPALIMSQASISSILQKFSTGFTCFYLPWIAQK